MRKMILGSLVLALFSITSCTGSTKPQPFSPSHPSTNPASASGSGSKITVDVPLPGAVSSGFGSVWVQSRKDGSLWRLSAGGQVEAEIPGIFADRGPRATTQLLATGFGSVWVLDEGAVLRIDPATNAIEARIDVPRRADSLDLGAGAVWIGCCTTLLRIDPARNAVIARFPMETPSAGISAGSDVVWWINASESASVTRVDPETRSKQEAPVDTYGRFVVQAQPTAWIIGPSGDVAPLRPPWIHPARTTHVANLALGAATGAGLVWINSGDLVGFDPSTGKVVTKVPVDAHQLWWVQGGIAVLGDRVWLADVAGDQVVGVGVATHE